MYFVRTASRKDLEAVSRLLFDAFHAAYDPLHGVEKVAALNEAWNRVPTLATLLDMPNGEFLVADSGRDLGGMAFAVMGPEPSTAWLRKLYVRSDLTGQGIGADLFAEIETCFPEARVLKLEVDTANEKAQRFYRRLGFTQTGSVSACGGDGSGLPAIIMEKLIDG